MDVSIPNGDCDKLKPESNREKIPTKDTFSDDKILSEDIECDASKSLSEMKLKDEGSDSAVNRPPLDARETLSSSSTDGEEIDSDEEEESTDDDDDSSSDDDDEIKAPLELIGEFLQYVRGAQWEKAQKLCTMILIYEPENADALQFKSVIEERIQMDEEESDEETSSEEESSDEEEEVQQQQPEEGENNNEGEEEGESSSEDEEDEEEEDKKEHIANPLIFPHKETAETPKWKP